MNFNRVKGSVLLVAERLLELPDSSGGEFLPLPGLCPLTSQARSEGGG